MHKKLTAYKIYLLFSGSTSLLFWMVFTVSIVYQIERIHLNPLQLILVGTTLETATFLFEVPTGMVADIYSRKLSVIIGLSLIGLGFIIEGSIMTFAAVLFSQVLWGIGYTFISGAMDAWIAGEQKDMELSRIYIRGSQAGQIGSIIGIVLCTLLANFSLRLPIILSGILFISLSIFFIFFMPENNFKSCAPEDFNTFGKMGHTIKTSLTHMRNNRVILLLLFITLFYGLSSEGYDRLSTAHFLNDTVLPSIGNLKPVTWFGIFSLGSMLISAVIMQLIITRLGSSKKANNAKVLLSMSLYHIICILVFALTKNFSLMLITYLSIRSVRTIYDPFINAWMNTNVDDNARATILSTSSQLDALGQILGGPIIGIISTKYSIAVGIACTTFFLVPVILMYILAIFKDSNTSAQYNEALK